MFNNNYNPYYIPNQRYQQPMSPTPMSETPQYVQPQYVKPNGLLGKQVDSIDVVRATEVPLDGSVSFFPLTDGSAIVTKQLQIDGTSKIVIFKPIDEEKEEKRYITPDELKKALNELNLDEIDEIKEDIKDIKKQLKKKGD